MLRLLCITFCLFCCVAPLQATNLWLKAESEVVGQFVRLNDLLEDESRSERYKHIFLGKVKGSEKIALDYIRRRLRQEGYLTLRVKTRDGSDAIVVKQVEKLSDTIVDLEPGKDIIEAPAIKDIFEKGKGLSQGKYVTLIKAVKRGDIISEDMIQLTDQRKIYRDGFVGAKQVIGLKSKRTLRKGTILLSNHVEIPMLIEKGETVKVKVVSPGIEISSIGRALADGNLGETIEVRRRSETILCRIIGDNLVEVEK